MPLPSEIYDRAYFLSDYCEGHAEFAAGRGLSALKAHQVALLAPAPGVRVLDAGCGRGEVLLACAAAGAQVAGIDYSAAAVEIAHETLADVPGADVVQGGVERLPWPNGHFDRVLCGDVIEHLDPGQADAALREFRRVLAPGGRLLVHTAPNRLFRTLTWPVARPLLRLAGHGATANRLDWWLTEAERFHVNEQTLHGLRRAVRRAGFGEVRAWLAADVVREQGGHHLTQGLDGSPLVRLAGRVAAARPARLLLSNDLYAVGAA